MVNEDRCINDMDYVSLFTNNKAPPQIYDLQIGCIFIGYFL